MEFELVRVGAGDKALQTVLSNLTKMYCYEWSQYTGMDVDERGRYFFEDVLPSYWEKPERKAFLLRAVEATGESRWAGLALMDKDFMLHPDYDHSMAEFFVMHKYRRHGAGRRMATALFDRYPGRWELGRNPKNTASVPFWDRVIGEYTNGAFELVLSSPAHRFPDGTLGDVFAFDTRPRAKNE